jgi:hypothetical protein
MQVLRDFQVQRSTSQYKVRPLKQEARRLLGFPHPKRVPAGVYAEQAIGISTDEFARAKDADVRYLRNVFPLLSSAGTGPDALHTWPSAASATPFAPRVWVALCGV